MKFFSWILIFSGHLAFAQSAMMSQLVYELRNPKTNADQFRHVLKKIGENLAKDILEELPHKEVVIQTLTHNEAKHEIVDENPVLITILRAGLPLYSGVQKVFPDAEVGFLGMARNEKSLKTDVSYIAFPNI